MSKFPDPSNYLIKKNRLLFKKFKGVYAYDADGNKYCDFHLNDGACFWGHNPPKLTHYIKNAVSVGSDTEESFVFHQRLFKSLSRYFKGYAPSVHQDFGHAILAFLHHKKPKKIAVLGKQLLNRIRFYSEKAEEAIPEKDYDLLIYEPIDFDQNLNKIETEIYRAKDKICVESRTFARIRPSLPMTQEKTLLIANTLSNGIHSALLLEKTNPTPSGFLPLPNAVCLSENLKQFGKQNFTPLEIRHPLIVAQKGSILKLNSEISDGNLRAFGIFLKDHLIYLSPLHSEHDLRRLRKALDSTK